MKEDHWLTMCKARSIENGVYLIYSNQVGNVFCGRSLVMRSIWNRNSGYGC